MTKTSPFSITEIMTDYKAIEGAMQRAVRDAVLAHARAGRSVPTWRDGKVVWLQPEEILQALQEQTHNHDR
jgi:hypothetical protein